MAGRRRVTLYGYKASLPGRPTTIAASETEQTQEARMPIDLLGTRVASLEQELARQALDIIRQPFKVRYLRDVRVVAISRDSVRADAGGWSDCWWFLEKYAGFVCNIALARYCYVVAVIFDYPGAVHYHAFDLEDESESGLIGELEGKFVHRAVTHFPGVFDSNETHIIVNTMAPPNAGLGSSGSVGVATVALLAQLAGKKMSRKEIALLAHKIEHEELGHQSGVQDQVAAAYGGISRIEMDQGGFPEFRWSPVLCPPGMIQQIETGLLLVSTGEKRSSGEEHEKKIAIIQAGGEGAQEALDQIIAIAEAAKRVAACLEQGDWPGVCQAFGDNWKHQVALDPTAETDAIKFISRVAHRHGATVKVGGAAGGGVLFTWCPDGRTQRDDIAQSLKEHILPQIEGAEIIPTKIAPTGVEVCSFLGNEFRRILAD